MTFFHHGELVVVETEDDQFLGTLEIRDDIAVLRSGFVGRPTLLLIEDIVSLLPTAEHPAVEA